MIAISRESSFVVVVAGLVAGCAQEGTFEGVVTEDRQALSLERAAIQHDAFVAEVGLPDTTLDQSATRGRAAITVGVADTGDDDGHAGVHAQAVASIISDLACRGTTDGACSVRVEHATALAQVDAMGRSEGSPRELAGAVRGLVDRWLAAKARGGADASEHLVVNLSVAWEPDGAIDGPPEANGADHGVWLAYDALRYATCHGALVIAAAGNDPGRPGSSRGPMLPAAWERFPARCDGEATARPVVYAAGGLHGDAPLPTTRIDGRPRLAAPANFGVGDDSDATPLAGSSTAAAVISSIAGMVWSRRPSLDAEAVVQTLLSSGRPLDASADFCAGDADCGAVVRVSMCSALDAADAGGSGRAQRSSCQSVEPPTSAWERERPFFDRLFEGAPRTTTMHADASLPEVPPTVVANRVRPQPDGNGCPACVYDSSTSAVLLDVADAATYHDPTLTLLKDGVRIGVYSGQAPSSLRRASKMIAEVSGAARGATDAVLTWRLPDGTSASEIIPVR